MDLLFVDPDKHDPDAPFKIDEPAPKRVKPSIERLPPSSILSKVKDFLPKMAEANKKLQEDINNNQDVSIEKVDKSKPYIKMNLALGVEEEEIPLTEDNIVIPTAIATTTTTTTTKPLIEILHNSSGNDSDSSDGEGTNEEHNGT